jgi:hypothetical protein
MRFLNWLLFWGVRPGDTVYLRVDLIRKPEELRGLKLMAVNYRSGYATLQDFCGNAVVVHRTILVL